jgi:S1-C subfamily serine protease
MKKDIIIAFNNEEVKNIDDLERVKSNTKIGDEKTLKIIRDKEIIEKKLILGDMPR